MLDIILTALEPHITELIIAGIGAVIAWTQVAVRKTAGVQAEEIYRNALHSALVTGARQIGDDAMDGDEAIEAIVKYVYQSVPDAVAVLNPSAGVLRALARSKLVEAGFKRLLS